MRAEGLARWMARIARRAWESAAAVTVQVFTTTTSAAAASPTAQKPRARNWLSIAAASACVARQPNCSMKKVAIETREGPRKDFHYNNARSLRGGFLLPAARVLPQDAFFARPCLCI